MTVSPHHPSIPLATAQAAAEQAAYQLFDPRAVVRYDIAGSIRREQPTVSDIELVCLARSHPAGNDLFGDSFGQVVPLEDRLTTWLDEGLITPRIKSDGTQTMGPKAKLLWYTPTLHAYWGPFKLDLFIVHDPRQYGLILAIRTGGAAFSRMLVDRRPPTGRGLLPLGWYVRDGWLYDKRGRRQDTSDEHRLFDLLGLDYIAPTERDRFAASMMWTERQL